MAALAYLFLSVGGRRPRLPVRYEDRLVAGPPRRQESFPDGEWQHSNPSKLGTGTDTTLQDHHRVAGSNLFGPDARLRRADDP